jgi:hypothetical protein
VRLYFDTNIYSFIRARNELAQVARLLVAHSCTLIASQGNLFEMYAIESPDQQQQEVRVLVELADEFESYPESWRHAVELRRELKRLRPKWLSPVPPKRRVRELLKAHRESWQQAKLGILPGREPYAAYKRDFEEGVSHSRHSQKELRQDVLNRQSDFALVSPDGAVFPVDVTDPEVYWRVDCLQVWYNAIEGRNPASRDYADWIDPYVRPGCFRNSSYESFWLREAVSEAMPLNRLCGLVAFYQLRKKISHGNAADQLHAGHWLRSDLFVTADRAFHEILTDVATAHNSDRPASAIVERSAASIIPQMERLLADHQRRRP